MKDLFNHQEELPQEVIEIIDKFNGTENTYNNCEAFVLELNSVGYDCQFELDAQPYNLVNIQIK